MTEPPETRPPDEGSRGDPIAGVVDATGRALAPVARGTLAVTRRLGLNRLAERALDRGVETALKSPAVERTAVKVLESDMVDRLWAHVLDSDEAQQLVERVAEAPEVRAAITRQGVGLLEDLRRTLRRATRRLDDVAESWVRHLFRKAPRAEQPIYAGIVSRAAAFGIDAAVINFALVLISAAIALIVSALQSGDQAAGAPVIAFGVLAWVIAATTYLVLFWSLVGRTPGMTFLGLRVLDGSGERLRPRRAVARALALPPAVIFFLLTRRPFIDPRRRSFQDRVADSVVLYADPEIDMERVDPFARAHLDPA